MNMEAVLEIIPEVVNLLSDVQEEYGRVESVAELCIELNNFVVAQETKVKIACILHRLLRGFMDRPMILLYGKFTILETAPHYADGRIPGPVQSVHRWKWAWLE